MWSCVTNSAAFAEFSSLVYCLVLCSCLSDLQFPKYGLVWWKLMLRYIVPLVSLPSSCMKVGGQASRSRGQSMWTVRIFVIIITFEYATRQSSSAWMTVPKWPNFSTVLLLSLAGNINTGSPTYIFIGFDAKFYMCCLCDEACVVLSLMCLVPWLLEYLITLSPRLLIRIHLMYVARTDCMQASR